MVASLGAPLTREGVIQYVGQVAPTMGLDPAAVLSVANHEGLNRPPVNGVGQTWILPNESGFNFGPPSFYSGGAGSGVIGIAGSNAPTWAWTTEGINYWLSILAKPLSQGGAGASGLVGGSAISAIVHNFERPRADLVAGEIQNAQTDYRSFQQAVSGLGISSPTDTGGGTTDTGGTTTDTGVTSNPTTTANPTVAGQTTANAGGVPPPPTGLNLSFGGSIQHIIFQFLLVLLGIALLLGGVYLIGSHK